MAEQKEEEKVPDAPRFLILGGCGFIGRHMVQYLITRKAASSIKVVDKRAPFTAYFTKAMLELFKNPLIQFIQCDLSKDAHIQKKKVFEEEVDYIINLCGETRFGQSDMDYQQKCVDTLIKCAEYAAKLKQLKKWVEVSSAQVYEPTKTGSRETARIQPFTRLASYRYECEKQLSLKKLPVVTLRPSTVYGPGDKTGITPRLVCAACYKHANEKMVFLWTKGVKLNTVHVRDLCSAMHIACLEARVGKIYNVSDKGDTTSGDLNDTIEKLFKIRCGFQNMAMNAAAKKMMGYAAKVSNDKHLPMWADVCKAYKITTTPLSPYLDQEILTKNHFCVDGSLIEKETSFKYKIPKLTADTLAEVVDEYAEQGYFPNINKM